MKKLTIIANPAAGNSAFGRVASDLVATLEASDWKVYVRTSTTAGECESLAREIGRGMLVCAAGGDGTVSEVINGLFGTQPQPRLCVFPCGTGNDFAEAVGASADPSAFVRHLEKGRQINVDVGRATWTAGDLSRSRLFCNVAGIGMDATAALRAVRWKKTLGRAAYMLAVVRTLASWPENRLRVTAEDLDSELSIASGLFASLCNGPRSGGDFLLAPGASVCDGLLDYCVVEYPGFLRSLRLLPGVRRGAHVSEPEVHLGRSRTVTVTFDEPQHVHIDGEILPGRVTALSASVLPSAVTVEGVRGDHPAANRVS